MTRALWTEIALALARARSDAAAGNHGRAARLDGIDRAARAVCRAIRARSSRFDGRHFMRIVGTQSVK